jgi:hypothetical protein
VICTIGALDVGLDEHNVNAVRGLKNVKILCVYRFGFCTVDVCRQFRV